MVLTTLLAACLTVATAGAQPTLSLTVTEAEAAETGQATAPANKVAVVRGAEAGAIEIDGKLADWKDCAWTGIGGDADCGGSFAVAVSPKGRFYLAVKVRDDVHTNDQGGGEIWRGDSIQFAVDAKGDRTEDRYNFDDYEYGLALASGNPVVWRWQAAGRKRVGNVEEAKLAVERSDDMTVYELRLPLEELEPMLVLPDSAPGFNIIINDADDGARDKSVQWTPGIAESKDPSSFGQLRFPKEIAFAQKPVLVQSSLDSIFADEEEDFQVDLTIAARDDIDLTLRALIKKNDQTLLTAEESYQAEAGSSSPTLHVALRGHDPAKLTLEVQVQQEGSGEPLYRADYTVYKYNSSLVR